MIRADLCCSFVALTHDFPVLFNATEPETRGGDRKNRSCRAVLIHVFHVPLEHPGTRTTGWCATAPRSTALTSTAAITTLPATPSRWCEPTATCFRMCSLVRKVSFGSEVMMNVDSPRIVTVALCA